MKSATVKLNNISLLKILSLINRKKVAGVITINQFSNQDSIEVWIWENSIVSVTGVVSLTEKVEYYNWLKPNLVASLKNENFTQKNIGSKLLNVYELTSNQIKQLFHEQIKVLSNLFTLEAGTINFRKITDVKALPYAEMTGREISITTFIAREIDQNIDRYLDELPEACLSIKSTSNDIKHIEFAQDTRNILEYANSSLTIKAIAKKLKAPRLEVQKRVYLLQLMDAVEVYFPSSRLDRFTLQNNQNNSSRELINFAQKRTKWQSPLVAFGGINVLVALLMVAGFFEGFELDILDRFFRLRGTTPNQDITLVTINDEDIEKFPTYPIADQYLTQTLENIQQHQPRIIGMDLYRNLPQPPGTESLEILYQNTDNLVGVEKVAGNKVSPPKILASKNQVGFADLIIDSDGLARRSLMSVEDEEGNVNLSLGTYLALYTLNQEGIRIKNERQNVYSLGQTKFKSLDKSSGGYWQGNDFSGLQTILNFQHKPSDFQQISFWDVYQNQLTSEIFKDKIVLIGVTADSEKDIVYNSFSRNSTGLAQPIPGVVIHANVTAQLLNAASGKYPMMVVLTKHQEIGLVLITSLSGMLIGLLILEINLKFIREDNALITWSIALGIGLAWLTISYFCFVNGLWIPTVTPIICSISSFALTVFRYKKELKKIVYSDKLTKTANRKYFDKIFNIYFNDSQNKQDDFSLVLCRLNNQLEDLKLQDKLLKVLSNDIQQILNVNDLLGRYENNLFGVLLAQSSHHQAEDFVKSLRKIINASSRKLGLKIDCDFGFSTSEQRSDSLEMILVAHEKLDSSRVQL